jgi:hypothetical protein
MDVNYAVRSGEIAVVVRDDDERLALSLQLLQDFGVKYATERRVLLCSPLVEHN